MLVTPISDHIGATEAAIDAIDRPGLDYTNIARGLAMALSMFKTSQADLSRAVLLISDGAGVIDPKLRDDLKAEFRKTNVSLYWLFLRTQGSRGISDQPAGDDESPQAAPERHLDLFFKSLGVPYQAFEAEGVEATEEALKQIDRLERHPVRYVEKLPRTDLSAWALRARARRDAASPCREARRGQAERRGQRAMTAFATRIAILRNKARALWREAKSIDSGRALSRADPHDGCIARRMARRRRRQ